ncbi:SRPBCC family protein [Pseudomonas sp. dw_358]|uniref:SRPBCC family protein n=1 Tax=Pseudomonas sp. dw_358 TaxID=2720083 RepID=UPI001BD379E3|nr:SRPBCC family protein [Pseudomonas sp. dw_358]
MRRFTSHKAALRLCVAGTLAMLLNGCSNTPGGPPVTTSKKTEMHPVSITLEETFSVPRRTLFDFIVAEDVLPKVLTGYGPLPGVVSTRDVSGPWDRPGSWRHVVLTDGGTAREQVTAFDRETYFAYQVSEFTFAVKYLATHAQGQWWFTEPQTGETQVRWTYTFYAKNSLAVVPLKIFATLFWRGYMKVCMDRTREQLGD